MAKKKCTNVRRVHIVTMCRLDEELQEESNNTSFGISMEINDDHCFFQRYPSRLLKYKRESKVNEPLFLVFVNNNRRNNDGFLKGTAFQNGRIAKEFSKVINNSMVQHHYYIEYTGRYYDSVNVKPYFEH